MGARPLRRAVERYLEDALSEELLKGEFEGAKKVIADAPTPDVERLTFTGVSEPAPAAG
jgi:ATP-dependent Clp protease ATP-binding subunit ClpA